MQKNKTLQSSGPSFGFVESWRKVYHFMVSGPEVIAAHYEEVSR